MTNFVGEPWVQELDRSTLQPTSGSFVSNHLRKRESDVVWRVRFRGDRLYVPLIAAFQSSDDP